MSQPRYNAALQEFIHQWRPNDPELEHLALSLVEAASSARTESWLFRFMGERVDVGPEIAARMIGEFRNYRVEEMQHEMDGDFERRSVRKEEKPAGGEA